VARSKRSDLRVKLIENVERDPEAVARALESWAIMLAEHAERLTTARIVNQSRP